MVVSTSRTAIACSWSSCIDGFHRSSRPSLSSGPRPSCAGIAAASAGTGGGNPAPLEADRRSLRKLRALIRRMSAENPLWGTPHIHGELLKLGFEVAQSRRIGGLCRSGSSLCRDQ